MGLANGANFVSGSILSYQQGNRFKNHWHSATAPSSPVAGMIWVDSADGNAYVYFDGSWIVLAGGVGATLANWNKSIGSGGDYADWATMITAMPELIAHVVTVTIKAGTTLTELCDIKNKHGLTTEAIIKIKAEKYFPTSGELPLADSATATTLRDAALATAALGDNYFNGCWIFIVHGTGTDNGFVPITDYVDATGDVVVDSWPGTQPDNTSRYLIVGAMVDAEGSRNGFEIESNTCPVKLYGIGIDDGDENGVSAQYNFSAGIVYCGIHGCDRSGFNAEYGLYALVSYCGIVGNNTDNRTDHGGVKNSAVSWLYVNYSGISDNNKQGILANSLGFVNSNNNFGDGNGDWGTYALNSGQAKMDNAECSGASGNHSDPATAGDDSADQAAVY